MRKEVKRSEKRRKKREEKRRIKMAGLALCLTIAATIGKPPEPQPDHHPCAPCRPDSPRPWRKSRKKPRSRRPAPARQTGKTTGEARRSGPQPRNADWGPPLNPSPDQHHRPTGWTTDDGETDATQPNVHAHAMQGPANRTLACEMRCF